MRLTELDAELSGTLADGYLWFMCPFPGCSHGIRLPISSAPFHERDPRGEHDYPRARNGKVKVWQASGEFPESLTIQPSVDICEMNEAGEKIRTICWHGHITNGAIA